GNSQRAPCACHASVQRRQEQSREMLESAAAQVCKKHPIPQKFTCQQQSKNFHQRFKTVEDTAREAMQSFRWHETTTLNPSRLYPTVYILLCYAHLPCPSILLSSLKTFGGPHVARKTHR